MTTSVTPISLKEAADRLGLSPWTTYQLALWGRLATATLGGRMLTTTEDVAEYVESLRSAA